MEKNSYEHRVYESVDDRAYHIGYISKINNLAYNGLNEIHWNH